VTEHVRGPRDLVRLFEDADRNSYDPCLIEERACYALDYPPGGVCRKPVTLRRVELFDGLDQTDVSFLDEIEKLKADGII